MGRASIARAAAVGRNGREEADDDERQDERRPGPKAYIENGTGIV